MPLWRQTPLSFRIGAIILVVHLVVAVTGPFWAPYGFSQMGTGTPLSGMSWAHPFGVDQLGRDVFSRVVHGAHIVILLSLSGTLLGLVVGAVLGLLSGYVGGWIDNLIQRLLESADQHPVPGAGAARHRVGRHRSCPAIRCSSCWSWRWSMRRASRAWRGPRRSTSPRAIS